MRLQEFSSKLEAAAFPFPAIYSHLSKAFLVFICVAFIVRTEPLTLAFSVKSTEVMLGLGLF
jgi:hypothetical protein